MPSKPLQLPILTSSGRFFHFSGLFLFLLLVFGPIVFPMTDLVRTLGNKGDFGTWLLLPIGRQLDLLAQSVLFSACVATGVACLGMLCGVFLWRLRSPAGIYLRWFCVLVLAIPPYIHAMAWMSLSQGLGYLEPVFKVSAWLPRGWFAAWWVEVMALTPLGTGMTLLGLESVTPRLVEAARIMRPEKDMLPSIALPLAKPLILAGAGFAFLFSLTDYTVPSLFQVNTYALEIFAAYSATNSPGGAFLLSLPLLAVAVAVLFLSQSPLRQAALAPLWHVKPWSVAPRISGWLAWSRGLVALVLAAQVLIPLMGLVLALDTGGKLMQSIISGRAETVATVKICLLAGLACLPPALAVARKLAGASLSSRCWWLLTTAPLAVPAPLVGIGLIGLWNRDLTHSLYTGGLMPVLAALGRFTPLAAILLCAQMRRMNPLLLDAARIYHQNALKTWVLIYFPMIVPGLLAAACITFILSAGELGATLLVVAPGQSTLTLRIYNYLHLGASERVAGLCLVMFAGALAAGMLAAIALHGYKRLVPRGACLSMRWT